MYDKSFEGFPGEHHEAESKREIPPEEDFEKSFEEGVPPFGGERLGSAYQDNNFYGETIEENGTETDYNNSIADAASIINYGLDAIARQKGPGGVEEVVQGIKSFNVAGSDNPIRDLYNHLGINTKEDFKDAQEESAATRYLKDQFRKEYSAPKTDRKSLEGAIKAIEDMKELITEVEGADPRYEEIRMGARAYGKGYFEYAIKDYGVQGLTELFTVLTNQKKKEETKLGEGGVEPENIETEKREESSEGGNNKIGIEEDGAENKHTW